MPNFKITYVDPDGKPQTIVKSFSDAGCISAYHYAEDFAFTLTDTGYFEIEEEA